MERAADTVVDITNGFPPVETLATTPPTNMIHLPEITIAGGRHSFANLPR